MSRIELDLRDAYDPREDDETPDPPMSLACPVCDRPRDEEGYYDCACRERALDALDAREALVRHVLATGRELEARPADHRSGDRTPCRLCGEAREDCSC